MFSAPRRSCLKEDVQETLAFLNDWQPTVFLPQCKPAHFAAAAQAGSRGLPWALTLHSDDPDYWATVGAFGGPSHGCSLVCVSRHIRDELTPRTIGGTASVIPCGIPELVDHERTGLLVSEDPAEAARALRRLADDPDLWRRCSTAARDLVAQHYSAEGSDRQWLQLLEGLDRQFNNAPSGPYPIDSRRIDSLHRIDPSFHKDYVQPVPPSIPLRQTLRTAIARAKHRIKRLLSRHP